jgi:hypothetical protein
MGSTLQKQDLIEILAMVKTSRQHLAAIEQTSRRAELVVKMMCVFSLYVGARYTKSLLLLELLLPDLETLTPETRAQIDQRLDQLEQKLDQIEQQTTEKILNLIKQSNRKVDQ